MAGKGSLPPDLSDLDPLNDPLFKDRNSTNGSRTAPVTKNTGSSALPTRPTSTDPLSLLMMDFDDQPQPQRHPIKDHVIDSHDRRHASVLLDLHSTPFASTSTQSVPIPRPSPRRRPSIDYSPPRRLSGIMQQQGPLISLDPSVSSPPLEPFHPASPTAGFAKSALEANENHQRTVRKSTSIEDWSDFQSFQHAPQTRPRQPSFTRGWPTSPKRAHSFPLVKEEQHVDEVVAILDSLHPIQLLGIRPGTIQILDEDIAEGVRPALPPRIRPCHRWKLLYSLDAHGTSFTMLYERMRHACDGHGPVLLVVKDTEGNRFGAYINQRLHRYEGYYGDSTWCAAALSSYSSLLTPETQLPVYDAT